jgi:hypothetical protein
MPYPTELTAGQLAMLRQTENVSFEQYLLLCPNTIVWQTQPAAQVDGTIAYARFEWDGTEQGDRADVREGQTVLITDSASDFTAPFYRGRVRTVPDATYFYINENSTNLETTYYVTVFDDFDMHEKLERRLADRTEYKDWDKTFEALPPIITNLQSVYVDISGDANVDIAFAPSVDTTASGAAYASVVWDIQDGAFQVGDANTLNITARFPGAATNEHRWVTLTVTDDNGVAYWFAFEVYTVDLTDTTPTNIYLDTGDHSITGSVEDGFNATVRGWDGIDSVLDRTRATIISVDNYNGIKRLAFTSGGVHELLVGDTITGATGGATAVIVAIDLESGSWAGGDAAGDLWINQQSGTFEAENLNEGANNNVATIAADSVDAPITSNVAFVGRLRTESNPTRGDEQYAVIQDTTFTIEGFGAQLARLVGPGLYLVDESSPDEWGEIQDLTIKRAIVYLLAWHSTFLNLCSLTFDADSDDYRWDEFVIQEASLLEWINRTADDHNAFITFAAAGEATIQRHASYTGTAGLTTVMTIEVDDSGDSDLSNFTLEDDYIETYAQAKIGAATYNTTTEESTVYIGKAPAQAFGSGWEKATLDNQILKADLSEADAITEVKLRTANHLAYVNPHERLTVSLMAALYWLTPSVNDLYAFDIEASDNTRGRAFTSSDKWLLQEITYTHNNETGVKEVFGTFEIVTMGGNAGIAVTLVPDVNDLQYPSLPPGGADGPIDPLINYPVDDPDFTLPGDGDWGLDDPTPPAPNPPVGCEILNVSMRNAQSYSTSNIAQTGETYIITVEGQGRISETSGAPWVVNFSDPTKYSFVKWQGYAGYVLASVDNTFGNPLPSGKGYEYGTSPVGQDNCQVCIRMDFPSAQTVTSVGFDWYYTDPVGDNAFARQVLLYDSGDNLLDSDNSTTTLARSTWHNTTFSFPDVANVAYAIAYVARDDTVGRVSLWMDNCVCSFVGTDELYGDAFYYGYNLGEGDVSLYGTAKGLLVDLAKPSGIPLYSPAHKYALSYTGSNAFIGFTYVDEEGTYTDNQNVALVVTVCGPGMGSVAL